MEKWKGINEGGLSVVWDRIKQNFVSSIGFANNQITWSKGGVAQTPFTVGYATTAGSAPASDVYAWAKASTKPSYTLDEVADGSTRKLTNYYPVVNPNGKWSCTGDGTKAYCHIANIVANQTYSNYPITFEIGGRGTMLTRLSIRFVNQSTTDPDVNLFVTDSANCYYLKKVDTNTWRLYASSPTDSTWGSWYVYRVVGDTRGFVTMVMTLVDTIPDDCLRPSYFGNVGYATSAGSAGSVAWSNVTSHPTKLSQFTDDLGTSPTHTHSQYVTTDTEQIITGKKTFAAGNLVQSLDDQLKLDSSYIVCAPQSYYAWHDHFAFLKEHSIQDVQSSTDGTSWVTSSVDVKPLFIEKEADSVIILRPSDLAFRFTLYSSNMFHSCRIEWFSIGVSYYSTYSATDVLVECSADNSTWTTLHSSNVNARKSTILLKCGRWPTNQDNKQKYVRFTFTKTTNTTTGWVVLNSIKGLTMRKGDQGLGRENEFPFSWDATPNVTFPAGVSATSFTENGTALSSKYLGINANAVSATKATQDGDGNTISSTYLKLSGGWMNNNVGISWKNSGGENVESLITYSLSNLFYLGYGQRNVGDTLLYGKELKFYTGTTSRMTIGNDGKVTIAGQLQLGSTTGTAPLIISSTTLVSNLNADLLDGQEGSYYAVKAASKGSTTKPIYTDANGAFQECGFTVQTSVPANALFTDQNVTQTATTTSAAYELLFSATADNTTRTEGARKTSTLTYNPSTKALSTGGTVNGLTLTAATTGFTISGGTTSKTLTVGDSYTLGTACSHAHGDYVTTITYDSTNRKLQQSKGGGAATDIVTFGTNAFNSTAYLPLAGGVMNNNVGIGWKKADGTTSVGNLLSYNTSNNFVIGYSQKAIGATLVYGKTLALYTGDYARISIDNNGNTGISGVTTFSSTVRLPGVTTTALQIYDGSNYRNILAFNNNQRLVFGAGTAQAGYDTFIGGKNITLQTGTSPTTEATFSTTGLSVVHDIKSTTGDIFAAAGGVAAQGVANLSVSQVVGTDFVTQVKVGTTTYSPVDGLVSLPAYPTASTLSGTLAISKGGTGATDAESARRNLGISALPSTSYSGATYSSGDGWRYDIWTPSSTSATFEVAFDPTHGGIGYVLIVNTQGADITVTFTRANTQATQRFIAPASTLKVPSGKYVEVSYVVETVGGNEVMIISWSSAMTQTTLS